MAAQFTCTACASSFDSSEEQRTHYKEDWHRYNLKRKVAGLTPVGREVSSTVLQLMQTLQHLAMALCIIPVWCVCGRAASWNIR